MGPWGSRRRRVSAELLRRLRTDAGFTQEELAEAARVSPRSISDLERGIHQTARKDTARLRADDAQPGRPRPGRVRGSRARPSAFNAAEGVPGPPGALARSVAATTPTLPHDIRSFTWPPA